MYVPLTVDYLTLREMLSSVQVGLLGGMTAIGDAIVVVEGVEHIMETEKTVFKFISADSPPMTTVNR